MSQDLKKIKHRLYRKLFPCRCVLCKQYADELICLPCQAQMPQPNGVCLKCGDSFHDHDSDSAQSLQLCGHCISKSPPFDKTIVAYNYVEHVAKLIQNFKYKENLMLCPFLAKAMTSQLHNHCATLPDALVPIPLHPSRLKQRGFNQAFELAKQISKNLSIPVYRNVLIRRRATVSQSGLSHNARARNMRGAFTLKNDKNLVLLNNSEPAFKGKHLMLVDDVITTGATMREAASKLRQLKPSQITLLAAAKTQRR